MILQQMTLDDALAQLEECSQARRELLKENILLRKANQEKDRRIAELEQLCSEIGEKLGELQHAQEDMNWRKRLEKVSYKRLSTPAKKTLAVVRDLYLQLPHDDNGFAEMRINAIVNRSDGVSYNTIRRHVREMAGDGILERAYEGNGSEGEGHRDTLKVKIDAKVLANPTNIDKIVSIGQKREEAKVTAWGGAREKKEPVDFECPNCGSPHTRGDIHYVGQCDDCNRFYDEWKSHPEINSAPSAEDTPVPTQGILRGIDEKQSDYSTAPITVQAPPNRGVLCAIHHTPLNSPIGYFEWNGQPQYGCAECAKAVSA